ncbi:hypothetical protein Tco_0825674 [Tanacetum coccineum]
MDGPSWAFHGLFLIFGPVSLLNNTLRKLVLSDSEEEEPKAQGRKSQDDPLDSLYKRTGYPSDEPKGRRYKRRKETKGKKVVSSLDFQEEVDTGAKEVNTAEGVNTRAY